MKLFLLKPGCCLYDGGTVMNTLLCLWFKITLIKKRIPCAAYYNPEPERELTNVILCRNENEEGFYGT